MPLIQERTPYYIRSRAVFPAAVEPNRPNWKQWLLQCRKFLLPNLDEKTAQRWVQQRSAAVLGGSTPGPAQGGEYGRRVQREWSAGLRSESIQPVTSTTRFAAHLPWPQGTPTGGPRDQRTMADYPTTGPQARRPVMKPREGPYGQILTAQDHRKHPYDLVPIAGPQSPNNLDYGPPPWRVPFVRRAGLTLQATQNGFGFPGAQGGIAGRYIIAPPVWSDPTRGTRGASGIQGRVPGGAGRQRVPATYTPRQVV